MLGLVLVPGLLRHPDPSCLGPAVGVVTGGEVNRVTPMPERCYTIVSNAVWDHPDLSLRAMGLLGWLLSRPPGWKTSTARIMRRFNIGRDLALSLFAELEEAGCLRRERLPGARGQFGATTFLVGDDPTTVGKSDSGDDPTTVGFTDSGPTDSGPTDSGESDPSNKTDSNKTENRKKTMLNKTESSSVETSSLPPPPPGATGVAANQGSGAPEEHAGAPPPNPPVSPDRGSAAERDLEVVPGALGWGRVGDACDECLEADYDRAVTVPTLVNDENTLFNLISDLGFAWVADRDGGFDRVHDDASALAAFAVAALSGRDTSIKVERKAYEGEDTG